MLALRGARAETYPVYPRADLGESVGVVVQCEYSEGGLLFTQLAWTIC